MDIRKDFSGLVGNTPLVRLRAASEATGCEILGKAEFLNPGQSVKDRAALYIIKDALARGDLKPGGTIVEGTAGNTGIGLALVGASLGFKTVIVIPDTQAQEKKDMIRLAGAELVEVPAAPYRNPNNYVRYSGRLAEALAKTEANGAIWANQFDNVANRQAHIETTGPEIWEQTQGDIDYFLAGIGTGGTLSGAARFLKEKKPGIRVIAVDPIGSVFYDYFKTGTLPDPRLYKVEGIGEDYLVKAVDFDVIDDMVQVDDEASFHWGRWLCRREGLFVGGSSGSVVAGALKIAGKLTAPAHMVVVLPDSGSRYLSKMYNDNWLKENAFSP